jgi:hypothetical protein
MKRKRRIWGILALSLMSFGRASMGWADESAEQAQRALILKGNELWGHYCSNCHNAPPAADRAPHEWDMIALHMRTRANLPAEHAQAIFAYLRSH